MPQLEARPAALTRAGGTCQLDVRTDHRLPEHIETAAYYIVAGGADLTGGSGLVGLEDRAETLGGHLCLHTTPGAGTTVHAALPLNPASPLAEELPSIPVAILFADRGCG